MPKETRKKKRSAELYAEIAKIVENKSGDAEVLPEVIELARPEESLKYFTMLEAFSDGMGGWRILEVFGIPLMELPDWLVSDLLVLRRVAYLMRKQNDERTRVQTEGGVDVDVGKIRQRANKR